MDMWSVGVILHIMLLGYHPFDQEGNSSDQVVGTRIQSNERQPFLDTHVGLSESAVELISGLMETDPERRMTAYNMLHHPWVQQSIATTRKEKQHSSIKKLELPAYAAMMFNLDHELIL